MLRWTYTDAVHPVTEPKTPLKKEATPWNNKRIPQTINCKFPGYVPERITK